MTDAEIKQMAREAMRLFDAEEQDPPPPIPQSRDYIPRLVATVLRLIDRSPQQRIDHQRPPGQVK